MTDISDSRAFSFLSLPYAIRMKIYSWALDWPDLRKTFARLSRECERAGDEMAASRDPKCTFPILQVGRLTTPTVLLLNRQISSEALPVLHAKTLVLDMPPPSSPCIGRPMDITEFISEETLQCVRRVVLKMDLKNTQSWGKTVETLLDVWCVKNSLEEVMVDITAAYMEPRAIIGEESSRQEGAKTISKVRIPNTALRTCRCLN